VNKTKVVAILWSGVGMMWAVLVSELGLRFGSGCGPEPKGFFLSPDMFDGTTSVVGGFTYLPIRHIWSSFFVQMLDKTTRGGHNRSKPVTVRLGDDEVVHCLLSIRVSVSHTFSSSCSNGHIRWKGW